MVSFRSWYDDDTRVDGVIMTRKLELKISYGEGFLGQTYDVLIVLLTFVLLFVEECSGSVILC